MSLWPCFMFFKLKITNILKSSGWGLEKSELSWEKNILWHHRWIACRTFSLPSFNGLCCKLVKTALFTYLILEMNWVYDVISHLICIFYNLQNLCKMVNSVFILSWNVQFQKISILPSQKGLEFAGGGGVLEKIPSVGEVWIHVF